ncbi:hypothetical protein AMELA_G00128970 [Ameiurus melas]|uniref:Uncharacterized protein n=1 Tax=Ameiurus melas TaxID=219545 RepID=A0A7J6APG4_AMEME|nr:hypothetical protein AMELA_G00128970 [Ameiurus melas]
MESQNWNDIKELILALAKEEKLYVVQNMALGAGMGFAATGLGICIGGVPGLLAGAAVGGVLCACVNGGFKPLSDFVKELSLEMQEKLYNGVKQLLTEVVWPCLDVLLEKVMGDTKLKNTIVSFIKGFFEGSVKIKVVHKIK